MSGMSGKAIRETLGFLAVVASMAFVGLEIQQNTVAIRGQTRQSLNSDYLEWQLAVASNPELHTALVEVFPVGVNSSPAHFAMFGRLRNLENVFLQVQEGVVDESVFESYGWTGSGMFGSGSFAEWWGSNRARFHPDFVAAFEAEYDLAP